MIDLGEYRLRKPESKDAAAIFRNYTCDEEVTKYLVWSPHKSLIDSELWIQHCIAKFDFEKNLKFIICASHTDEAIGMIDATVNGHQAVVGYVLSRRFWGNGIMTRALSALSEELLSRSTIFRVYATHDIENLA